MSLFLVNRVISKNMTYNIIIIINFFGNTPPRVTKQKLFISFSFSKDRRLFILYIHAHV